MSCTQKQLILNRLVLPKDVKDHIKDFIFVILSEKMKYIMYNLSSDILTAWGQKWHSEQFVNSPNSQDNGYYRFRLEKVQLFIPFCTKCGNYNTRKIYTKTEFQPIIQCHCL